MNWIWNNGGAKQNESSTMFPFAFSLMKKDFDQNSRGEEKNTKGGELQRAKNKKLMRETKMTSKF